ncbi:MAG: hypothetical protein ACLQAT_13470 [Candidatus Binataceae bacterium]
MRRILGPEAACLFLLLIITYTTFWPGILNADSIDQLDQSLKHQYFDYHSPAMSGLWSLTNRLSVGPAPMLLLKQSIFYLAMFIFITIVFQNFWSRFTWSFALIFYPPIFNVLGLVTPDGFFVPVMFLAYVLALLAVSQDGPVKSILIVLVHLLLLFAVSIRPEGVVGALPLIFALHFNLLSERLPCSRWSRLYRALAGGLSATVIGVFMLLAVGFFNSRIMKATPTHSYQGALIFDLVGLSIKENSDLLPRDFNPGHLTVNDFRQRYNPADPGPLVFDRNLPDLRVFSDSHEANSLLHAWLSAVREHPLQYLKSRCKFASYLLGSAFFPFQFLSDPNTYGYFESMQEVHAVFTPTLLVDVYLRISTALTNTVIFKGGFYCLILIASGAFHTRQILYDRLNWQIPTIGLSLAAGGLMQTWVLFFVAAGAEFRYIYWPVLAAILSLTLACKLAVSSYYSQSDLGERPDPLTTRLARA